MWSALQRMLHSTPMLPGLRRFYVGSVISTSPNKSSIFGMAQDELVGKPVTIVWAFNVFVQTMYFCVVICVWCNVCMTHSKSFQESLITYHIMCKHCGNSHSSTFGCGFTVSERKASILNESGHGDLAVFRDERKQWQTTSINMVSNHWKHCVFACKMGFSHPFFRFMEADHFVMVAWLEKNEGLFCYWKCGISTLQPELQELKQRRMSFCTFQVISRGESYEVDLEHVNAEICSVEVLGRHSLVVGAWKSYGLQGFKATQVVREFLNHDQYHDIPTCSIFFLTHKYASWQVIDCSWIFSDMRHIEMVRMAKT